MSNKVFKIKNRLQINSDEFYLDPNSADVNFVFGIGTDHVEYVPAHRIILSVGSSVFDTMFNGSLPEKSDISIGDTSAAVFKEFLQLFYLNKVQLSPEHIADVINLCKMYEMAEALKICEAALQSLLIIDDMCFGYALAILYDLTSTIEFCEQEIVQNARKIFCSASFLECNRNMVDRIIQLVKTKLELLIGLDLVIAEAYMDWAKAECGRKNLEETLANLKAQLGPSFSYSML
ncbi:BTB/POZ domain-containing protein 6-A-like [Sitodiplosis mosellana]|uniref:BTB/POZ domain-containing protein 6-A-like n=1 Tax=Sitodiplosis mosellana TaxID=263140 RepID=UPI0024441C2D|nr:BTB/POZ domain-containing protein 6-A-like [Sitodiplosis mosellana]